MELLKLIQVEFLKLRRRKFIWLMLLAALFMPLAAVFYFSSVKGTGVDPIMFYKWTAFSYTPWIILPVVLGMLCTMLMYNENQYDMLKQLWIVPVNKMAYFFSKFAVVLVYSICFMLVTATASILTGILSGYIPFDSESVLYLFAEVYGNFSVDRLCGVTSTGGCRSAKGLYSPCLPDADLYIPRLYPLDGEYVPTSAVQYDRYCYV